MKKRALAVSLMAIAVIAGGLSFSSTSDAKGDPQKEAEGVVTEFETSLTNQDFEKAASLMDDFRFSSKEEQIESYKDNESSDEKILDFHILSSNVIDKKKVEVEIEVTTEAVGTQTVTLPVEKKGKDWKIVIKKAKNVKHKKSKASDFQ